MKHFKAAIFDVDGVLVDSAPLHMQAWQTILKRAGVLFNVGTFREFFGCRDTEVMPRLVGLMDDAKISELQRQKQVLFEDLITKHAAPTVGLKSFLTLLRQKKISTAIASSAPKKVIETILKTIGTNQLRIAISGEQAMRGKPAPDIFLMAAYRLGVQPFQTVIFEDAVSGIEAARAAGATTVALTTYYATGQLSHADLIITDFTDPKLTTFLFGS